MASRRAPCLLLRCSVYASLGEITHVIQVALTPVFLLSGIAALLNVFSTRLGRVADRVDELSLRLETSGPDQTTHLSAQLAFLRRRSLWLDAAVVLGGIGGALTCTAATVLFVGALRDSASGTVLLGVFGAALVSTIGALGCFIIEMLLAGRGLRDEVEHQQATSNSGLPGKALPSQPAVQESCAERLPER